MKRSFASLVAATLLASCSGAGSASPIAGGAATGQQPSVAAAAPSSNAGGPSAAGGAPVVGGSSARVRIVNLYALPDGTKAVAVYAGTAQAAGAQPLLTVPYGQVSDYIALGTSGATLVPEGDLDKPELQPYIAPSAGEQDTIVFTGNLDQGKPGFNAFELRESRLGDEGQPFATGAPGQPLIEIFPGALMGLSEDSSATTFFYGVPGKGCLTTVSGDSTLGFGGNGVQAFVAPAASFQLVAWSGGCKGTVAIGPVTVDASSGRVLVVPYGPSRDKLTLLVMAIPETG